MPIIFLLRSTRPRRILVQQKLTDLVAFSRVLESGVIQVRSRITSGVGNFKQNRTARRCSALPAGHPERSESGVKDLNVTG